MRLRDRLKLVAGAGHGFRRAEKQDTALAQGEMEQRKDALLHLGPQVDQEIAATDQIEARKRRIGHHVVDREHDRRAELARHPVAMIFPGEEAAQPVGRHVSVDRRRVKPFAGGRDGVSVDIRGENLQLQPAPRRRDLLQEQHGDGIGFLAGAAARHPDPDRPVRRMRPREFGNDCLRQHIEGLLVAEKPRDVDEQIIGEVA